MNKLLLIGDILMVILAISSLVISFMLITKIVKSQEYKDIRYTKNLNKDINSLTHLRMEKGLVVPISFIYGHKNIGSSPCDLKKLEIDESYLTENSHVLMNEEGY